MAADVIENQMTEIAKLQTALRPFAEWDETDEKTHWFLSDPGPWAAAKAAYGDER